MTIPNYGIYKILPNGTPVWIENASDLQAARIRVTELSQRFLASFVVYDLRRPARPVFELKQKMRSVS